MRYDKNKALKLRLKGRSYNEIAKLAGIPKSTLSGWFAKLQLPKASEQRLAARVRTASIKGLLQRNISQTALAEHRAKNTRITATRDITKLSKKELLLIGSAFYWTGGYKRPISIKGKIKTHHPVSFSNSDPALIKIFVGFLRKVCEVPNDRIYVELRTYEHQDQNYLIGFWSKAIDIPTERIRGFKNKPNISGQHKRPFDILPYGTIQIRVNSTELYHKIMGWIEGLSKV